MRVGGLRDHASGPVVRQRHGGEVHRLGSRAGASWVAWPSPSLRRGAGYSGKGLGAVPQMVSAAGSSPVLVPGLEVLVSDDVLPGLLVMPAQLSVVPLDKENDGCGPAPTSGQTAARCKREKSERPRPPARKPPHPLPCLTCPSLPQLPRHPIMPTVMKVPYI